jgi:hypothetical protein
MLKTLSSRTCTESGVVRGRREASQTRCQSSDLLTVAGAETFTTESFGKPEGGLAPLYLDQG